MMLDYYGIDTILCMMIGHLQYYCQLATNCRIVGYLQAITSQAAYYGIGTISLHWHQENTIYLTGLISVWYLIPVLEFILHSLTVL
jgi:hypothetical protein